MRLQVKDLVAGYDGSAVLNDVAGGIRGGAVTALIGPNAAGKTTLLRCMIGALGPMEGGVRIGETFVHRMTAGERARCIAYVAQRAVMAGGFTTREVVGFGRYALMTNTGRIDAAMEEADVADLAERRFTELSVGQQQRVMLARALAQVEDDGVLALDEPMAGMDPRHMLGTARVLRRCADRGVAVIVAMHDLTLTARHADDVWVLDGGRLVGAGPTAEVMTDDLLGRTFGIGVERIEAASGTVILPTDRLGCDA